MSIRGVRRRQSHFPDFFPSVKFFSPVENFHFGRPKTSFGGFEKWKAKKKKKKKRKRKRKEKKKEKSSPHFPPFISLSNFSSFHFQFSIFPFTIFLLFFSIFLPFFLASFFPVGQQKFPGQKFLGGALCPLPRLLRHCCQTYRERRRLIGNTYEWHRNYLRTSGVEDVEEAKLNKEKGHTCNKWFYCSKYRSW